MTYPCSLKKAAPRRVAASVSAGLLLVASLVAEDDFSAELPRVAPLAPTEALGSFEIVPGYRVEQVAAEPLVADPVAISFDARGRMYVVCMRGYSEQGDEDLGEVRRLDDIDGDGRFDSSAMFAAGLSWPTGIVCYDGGVFVAVAPDILFLKDTNGDGIADERRLVFTGFHRKNVQGLLNSLSWGLDNRIHGATSSSGADVARPGTEVVRVGRRDFSFDPRSDEFTPTSGGAQHGLSFDDWGRKFVCSNSRHMEMVVLEERYLRRNPKLQSRSARELIAAEGAQAEIHRISPVEPWRTVRTRLRVAGQVPGPVESGGRASGYFTSATGVTIYRGDAWPEQDHGVAFVGDVGSNVVHRKRLRPDRVLLKAERADPGREFLASRDIWFRPVQFANAPDGTLYVIDMYREVIEHPLSLPPVIKKHLDLTSGRDRGRIYRVVPEGFGGSRQVRLDEATPGELVATLEHPNGWHRDTAARLIYERQDKTVGSTLEALVATSPHPLARMHALYALRGLNVLSAAVVEGALADRSARVVEHAVRLAERFAAGSPTLRSALYKLAEHDDARVRFQLALTLGALEDDERLAPLGRILAQGLDEEWTRLAVESALSRDAETVFGALLLAESTTSSSDATEALRRLSRLIGAQGDQEALARWLDAVVDSVKAETPPPVAAPSATPAGSSSAWERAAGLLQALARGRSESGVNLRRSLVVAGRDGALLLDGVLERARNRARDAASDLGARDRAIRILALSSYGRERESLLQLLGGREPPQVQLAALDALSSFHVVQVAQDLLESWSGWTPKVRQKALDVILERPERVTALLDAIEDGNVSAGELAPTQRRSLRDYPRREIKQRARKILPEVQRARREEVVASYRPSLTQAGDAVRGQAVFTKNCASCHEFGGVGYALGPNITSSHERGLEGLLQNILDPNREVDPQYTNYELVTGDGRVLSGLISSESAGSITIERGAGQRETVSREDLASLKSSGVSLMPEGLEAEIDATAMADLLTYLSSGQVRAEALDGGWRAGVSKRNITPLESLWLSGYASRDRPSEGKLTDLWAKALYMQDPDGRRAVLVTLDLIGIARGLSLAVRKEICKAHGLELADVALATSHTHTGPVVGKNLDIYGLDDDQAARVERYAQRLARLIVEVVAEASANVAPTRLEWGTGRASFAVNRRENREADVPRLRASGKLKGPVDHDVPVLRVATAKGRLLAVVFGYACHCTVLSSYEWSGDYAGFAQMELEKNHPSALALFWAGCGADQNPLPRRTVALARGYGRELAVAVEEVLDGHLQPIRGRLRTAYEEIDLPFAPLPSAGDLAEQARSENRYVANRARILQARIANDGPLSPTYPYPVQSWQLGSRLRFVLLGGEVVVDYALRLKHELGPLWIAAYSNDVMAYIPSRRVLAEGGYEGATSMIYYAQPTVWAPDIEDMIVEKVNEQLAPEGNVPQLAAPGAEGTTK